MGVGSQGIDRRNGNGSLSGSSGYAFWPGIAGKTRQQTDGFAAWEYKE
ncbi:MAG: hypothetical protein KDA96_16765 [Planctomycetaceae bacterium]|nr:hypothetical protein [Planctomycetaceae bacterium]